MTKVYVIMGNDYPSGVVSHKKKAEKIVKERMEEQKKIKYVRMIYWRWYVFELDGKL